MKRVGDGLKGPQYRYLGHFAKPKHANRGHNDTPNRPAGRNTWYENLNTVLNEGVGLVPNVAEKLIPVRRQLDAISPGLGGSIPPERK